MASSLRPSKVFELLRSNDPQPGPGGESKLELAKGIWAGEGQAEGEWTLPNKEVYLAQWMLEAGDKTPRSTDVEMLGDPVYWELLLMTLEAMDSQIRLSFACRSPVLRLTIRLFERLHQVLDDEALLNNALGCLRHLLPTAAERALSDIGLELILATLKAGPPVAESISESAQQLTAFALHEYVGIVSRSSNHRRFNTHFLETALPDFLKSLVKTSDDRILRGALLEVVQAVLFATENLKRMQGKNQLSGAATGTELEWFAPLRKAIQTPELSDAVFTFVPLLLDRLVSTLASTAPALFPLPKASSTPGSNLRSASETHQRLSSRSLVLHFLTSVLGLVKESGSPAIGVTAIRQVVQRLKDSGLYGPGRKGDLDVLRTVAANCTTFLTAAPPPIVAADSLATLNDLFTMDGLSLDDHLPSIFEFIATLPVGSGAAAASKTLLSNVLDFHARSKQLPSFISLCSSSVRRTITATTFAPAMRSPVASPDFTTLWIRDITDSLGPTQIIPTLEALRNEALADLQDALEVENSQRTAAGDQPPKKKKRKSSPVPTGQSMSASVDIVSAPYRLAVSSHFLSSYLRSVDLEPLRTADRRLFFEHVAALRVELFRRVLVAKKLKSLRKTEAGLVVIAAVADIGEAIWAQSDQWDQESNEEAAEVLDGLIAPLRKLLGSGLEGAGAAVTNILLLLFSRIKILSKPGDAIELALDAAEGLLTSPGSVFDGVVWGAPAQGMHLQAWWLVIVRHVVAIERHVDRDQARRFASLVFSTAPTPTETGVASPVSGTPAGATQKLLSSPVFYELGGLRFSIVAEALHRLNQDPEVTPEQALQSKAKPDQKKALVGAQTVATLCRFPGVYFGTTSLQMLVEAVIVLDILVTRQMKAKYQATARIFQIYARHFLSLHTSTELKPSSLVTCPGVLGCFVFAESVRTAPPESLLAATTGRLLNRTVRVMLSDRDKDQFPTVAKSFDDFLGRLEGDIMGSGVIEKAMAGGQLPVTEQLVLRALEMVTADGKDKFAAEEALPRPMAPLQVTLVVSRLHDFLGIENAATDHLYRPVVSVISALSSTTPAKDSKHLDVDNVASALRLFQHHIQRNRSAEPAQRASAPFEALVAAYVKAFERFGATSVMTADLVGAVRTASVEDYAAALEGLWEELDRTMLDETLVHRVARLEALSEVASLLLRNGPENTGRVARHYSTSFILLFKEGMYTSARTARDCLWRIKLVEAICDTKIVLLNRQSVGVIFSLILDILTPRHEVTASFDPSSAPEASRLYASLASVTASLVRRRRSYVLPIFHLLICVIVALLRPIQRQGFDTTVGAGKRIEREAAALFPAWAWSAGPQAFGIDEARMYSRVLTAILARTASTLPFPSPLDSKTPTSLVPAMSKHAPFYMLAYLRACTDALVPLPLLIKNVIGEEVMQVMGTMHKYEKDALMRGYLKKEDEAERALLKGMWKTWDQTRYKGEA